MLLSIIIPTKGRNEFLCETVTSILDMKLHNTEIVIQDNNEVDSISDCYRNEIDDKKIRYNHSPSPLSFVDNFECAVDLASGEYVTVIGDDDLVNPEIIEIVEKLKHNEIDAIIPANKLHYLWSGSKINHRRVKALNEGKGLFTISPFSGVLRKIDPVIELTKLLKNGGVDYLSTNMPRLYHGIVSNKILKEIRAKEGRLFGGLTPDIYVSCMISLHAKKVYSFDYPLTIPGSCSKSGSVASSTGDHTGNLKDAPHFNHRGSYHWNDLVPRFYSVETIWADTAFAAVKDSKSKLYNVINPTLLYSICYFKHKKYRSFVKKVSKFGIANGFLHYAIYKLQYYIKIIYNKVLSEVGLKRVGRVELFSIHETVEAFNEYKGKLRAVDYFILKD